MNHARLSPSSAHRWMLCPGSIREEAPYPDTDSLASIDGTHSHTLLENCLALNKDPMLFVGETLVDHSGEFEVDIARAERVSVAINYVAQRKAELGVCSVRAEDTVNAGLWLGREDMAGTADVQLISDNILEVIDYKDGYVPVKAKNNPQPLIYLLGAIWPYLVEREIPFSEFRITIIQPKLIEQGIDPVWKWDLTIVDLAPFLGELKTAAAATDYSEAPLIPGEKQCHWCPHKANCSALGEKVLTEAQVLFDGVMADPKDIAAHDASNYQNVKLGEILEALPLINQFLGAVEEEALRRMQEGKHIPGMKVVRGRGSRKWKIEDETLLAKFKSMGIPKDKCYSQKLLSPAQAEKVTWENRKKEKKTLSERQQKVLHEEYIEKTPGKLTVVSESDSREAVVFDAKELFKDVTVTPEIPAWLSGT